MMLIKYYTFFLDLRATGCMRKRAMAHRMSRLHVDGALVQMYRYNRNGTSETTRLIRRSSSSRRYQEFTNMQRSIPRRACSATDISMIETVKTLEHASTDRMYNGCRRLAEKCIQCSSVFLLWVTLRCPLTLHIYSSQPPFSRTCR